MWKKDVIGDMVSVELRGRLGNQLFQYAVCRIMAEKLDCDFSISDEWLGKNIFNVSLGKRPYHKSNVIFDEKVNKFNPEIFNIEPNTHLFGFWQSEKYFVGYETKIRQWLSLDVPNSDYLNEEYCTIHFRAQDGYLRENWVLPPNYFERAKEYVRNNINKDIKFVIVTDNPQLASHYFPKDIIISNDMKTDLSILTHSKNKIISNSSFSWWAAWLGLPDSNVVVAPNRWINYNHTISSENTFYPHDIKTSNFVYV